ncbi:MAG: Ig-like domain-containing protein [Blastocatellia bacterium]|nr:Ig-like domain-containing protein [Blastocatellia bacterium]
MRATKTIFLFLLIFASPALAEGTDYYVAQNGSDSNAGTEAAPFATIQKAASAAVAGDTIIVKPGIYAGAKFSSSGTQLSPIKVMGEPGAIVSSPGPQNTNKDNLWIRNSSYIIIEGFEVHSAPRAGIAVQGEPDAEVHGVIIRNNHSHNNGRWGVFTGYAEGTQIIDNETSYSQIEHGIYVSNSADNPVIAGNLVDHNNASGIQINADPVLEGDGIISNALIESNIIFENGAGGGAAINLASVTHSLIRNNLLYQNHASGIAGWDDGEGSNQFGTHHNKFLNNTIVQASNGRFALVLINGSSDNQVLNNILIHTGTRGSIEADPSSEAELHSDFNVVVDRFSVNESFINLSSWQSRGHDPNSFIATPTSLFVNAALQDYHLWAGSPAIDKGTAVPDVAADIEGSPRPQGPAYDIGAYEHPVACGSDSSPPSVSITAPTSNATAQGAILFSADASDDCSIAKVEFYVDGNLIGTRTSSPYSINWNTASVSNGNHTLMARAYDPANNDSFSQVNINIANAQGFHDDFEDGDISDWSLNGGSWRVLNGNLEGTSSKPGEALAPFEGCGVCTIETSLETGSRKKAKVSLLGWYRDAGNYVELAMIHAKNKWVLTQYSNGNVVARKSFSQALEPDVAYDVQLRYDGENLRVVAGGDTIMTLVPGTALWGNVGFRVKKTTGRFPEISVF